MEGILITLSLFAAIFGVFYLHFTTRNKERMALIEKGGDASMFYSSKRKRTAPVWKVLILNLSVLLIGIGIGVFLAAILNSGIGLEEEVAYPGSIFLMAGIGLFVGFTLSRKMIETDEKSKE
jgi:hypothetical protein